MGKILRIAAIGFGRHFRRSLLPNIIGVEQFLLTDVAEVDPELRKEAELRFPSLRVHNDADDCLRAGGFDAVVIATDPRQHVELVRKSFSAGVHVFVEKPLGTTAAEIDQLISARPAGVVAMVGTMWRYAGTTSVIRNTLSQRGTDVVIANMTASFPSYVHGGSWSLGGRASAFFEMFVHPIDWLVDMLGDPYRTSAQLVQDQPELGRLAVSLLTQHSRGSAALSLATGMSAYQVSAWLGCDDGTVIEMDTFERVRVTSQPTWSETEGGIRDWPSLHWESGQLHRGWARRGYAEEFRELAACIRDHRQPRSDLEAHRKTIALVAASLRAVDEQCSVELD